MDLSPLDYKILDFISQFDSVSKNEIINAFADNPSATNLRLKQLSKSQNHHITYQPIENSSYIYELYDSYEDEFHITHNTHNGLFCITDLGAKALQNYKLEKRSALYRKYEEWLWRLIPIIISLVAFLNSAGYLGFHK